ncbi:MAG: type II toxin-antitoxin system RelE/ParE family toxin [Candidatus Thiodiazotropha sp. (ex Dulcina madagascariensis)]|nr:type II toxin-antitoxin system RelE/ParE family toxin [Candidatus Thiodiazotropha sp. (ex Dulcina madagascariensis)]
MSYAVFLTEGAENDLVSIYNYIYEHDAPGRADHVLHQIESTFSRLADLPERGSYPKELAALGIHEYREVLFKPYRIVYRVVKKTVFIMLIIDGRRDMQTLLQRRLLDG